MDFLAAYATTCTDVKDCQDGLKKGCCISACSGDQYDPNWCGKGAKIRILSGVLGLSENPCLSTQCCPGQNDCTDSIEKHAKQHFEDIKILCEGKLKCLGVTAFQPTQIRCEPHLNDTDYEVITYDCEEGMENIF